MPIIANFEPCDYQNSENLYGQDVPAFTPNPVLIAHMDSQMRIMSSKAAPKKITLVSRDDTAYAFLLKSEARIQIFKEVLVMEVLKGINRIFQKDKEARSRNFFLELYALVGLDS
jgi:phosphatidylinositol kinase/protein kinase (PI-3  family)